MGLSEARRTLGLSASTLRRLADSGTIRTFVTPGGHRRFSRTSVQALLPTDLPHRPPMARLGETPERLVRRYHRAAAQALPWIGDLDSEDRLRFRAGGRRIVTALLAALDAPGPRARRRCLSEARAAGAEYGRAAGAAGLPASVTVEVFARMRQPFLEELSALARRRDFDAAATTGMLAEATAALDDLLLSTLRAREGVDRS
jgi:excisionase family DNA binding protein